MMMPKTKLIHYSVLVAGTWGLRSNSVMTILRHVLVGDTTSFIRTAHARKRYMTNLNLKGTVYDEVLISFSRRLGLPKSFAYVLISYEF